MKSLLLALIRFTSFAIATELRFSGQLLCSQDELNYEIELLDQDNISDDVIVEEDKSSKFPFEFALKASHESAVGNSEMDLAIFIEHNCGKNGTKSKIHQLGIFEFKQKVLKNDQILIDLD